MVCFHWRIFSDCPARLPGSSPTKNGMHLTLRVNSKNIDECLCADNLALPRPGNGTGQDRGRDDIKIVGKRVALPDHREGYRGITIDRILLLGIQAAKVQVAEC